MIDRREGAGVKAMAHRLVVGLVASLCLASCGTSVTVEGTLPTPVVEKIPLRMGIYFPDEFNEFAHEERISERGNYRIDIGVQNRNFFERVFNAMFDELVEVPSPPLSGDIRDGIDAIIVPEIEKYGFLSPHISGLNFYSASIHYRMHIYDLDGVPLAEWTVVGYGKSPKSGIREANALSEATILAIRDGGARIALETRTQPEVQSWLQEIGID